MRRDDFSKTIVLMERAIARRAPLLKTTNAVRLINGLGDKLPGLILEQYARHCVVHLLDKTWSAQKEALADFIKTHLSPQYLIFKERSGSPALKSRQIKTSVLIKDAPSNTVVTENGLRFEVDLNDGLNSGLFLDMRANRKTVAGLAKNRRVLNAFAYTCSFGVYCRSAGATEVVNIDISRKALERGAANYRLNNLSAGDNEFVRADAAFYLERAAKKDNRFDLIILDPPSFARHESKTFTVKKDMPRLVASALNVLKPGGVLFISTNFSGLSSQDLERMARAGGRKFKSVAHFGQDADFPGSGKMAESCLAAVLVKS